MRLTQVMMEKKENDITARGALPALEGLSIVLDHWLVRTQKQMNHKNVQAAAKDSKQRNKQPRYRLSMMTELFD